MRGHRRPALLIKLAGAVVLSSISAESAEPVTAAILFALGLYVLLRFVRAKDARRLEQPTGRHVPWFALGPLGIFAGFMDAAGGGGWGPISTPALLSSGRMQPRKVIGSIDTSEFLVAVASAASSASRTRRRSARRSASAATRSSRPT